MLDKSGGFIRQERDISTAAVVSINSVVTGPHTHSSEILFLTGAPLIKIGV